MIVKGGNVKKKNYFQTITNFSMVRGKIYYLPPWVAGSPFVISLAWFQELYSEDPTGPKRDKGGPLSPPYRHPPHDPHPKNSPSHPACHSMFGKCLPWYQPYHGYNLHAFFNFYLTCSVLLFWETLVRIVFFVRGKTPAPGWEKWQKSFIFPPHLTPPQPLFFPVWWKKRNGWCQREKKMGRW